MESARGLIAEKRSVIKDFDLAGREETTPFAMACGGKVSVSFKYYNHATADEFSKDYAAYLQNPKCYIFGAGHVAGCLSKVLDFVGFDVYVYDPRPEFANKEHHPKAKGIFSLDYNKIPEHIAIGESDYAAIADYLRNNEFDKEDFSKFLVNSFYEFEKTSGLNFSYCAIKTSEFDNFIPLFNEFCNKLMNMVEDDKYHILRSIRENLELVDSAYKEFCDLGDFLHIIPEEVDKLGLLQSLSDLIVESKSTFYDNENILGLGINFPLTLEAMTYYYKNDEKYEILDFYKNTFWDEFLISFFNNWDKNN